MFRIPTYPMRCLIIIIDYDTTRQTIQRQVHIGNIPDINQKDIK